MKKFLLSIATVALGLSAYAGTVTFDFKADTYGLPAYNVDNGNDTPYAPMDAVIKNGVVEITLGYTVQVSEDGKEISDGGWRIWSDGLRAYYKRVPTFTVKTTNGDNITKVSWNAVSGATFALAGTTENITNWIGSEASVTFNYTGNANKAVESITVVYGEAASEDPEPEVKEFTVAEALAYLAEGESGEAIVTGIVSEVTNFNATYGSITYYIVDKEGDMDALQIYGGLGLNGAKFASMNDLPVGSTVQVQGKLKNYTNADGEVIPEMDMNSVILKLQYPEDYEPEPTPEGIISVSEALDLIIGGYSGEATVEGYIIDIEEVSTNYGNATYTIADDADAMTGLVVFRGKYIDGEAFTSEDQIELGAKVVVKGTLVYYNNETPEFTSGSVILSYEVAGVESLEIDLNAPVVYYNLQGMRVDNPSTGLYIIRQGNKSVKAIIR